MDRTEIIRKLTELADSILLAKGKDYTAGNWDTDPNYNFNAIAELLKGAPITPYTVCMIYFMKHVFSLIKYAKTGIQEGGEGLEGRHADAMNYTRILWTLVGERVEEELAATKDAEFEDVDLEPEQYADNAAEIERMTGIDPIDWTASINYKNTCSCPSCRRVRERNTQLAQDWLDRVNEQLNNNKQE